MGRQIQIVLLILILAGVGLGAALYKHLMLGFPLLPKQQHEVWSVETLIEFEADGGPVAVRMNLPDDNPARKLVFAQPLASGYSYQEVKENDLVMGLWQADNVSGKQKLFFRAETFFAKQAASPLPAPVFPLQNNFDEPLVPAVKTILADSPEDPIAAAQTVLKKISFGSSDVNMALLLDGNTTRVQRLQLAADLLAVLDFYARPASGLRLQDKQRKQVISRWLEVFDGTNWRLIDPGTFAEVAVDKAIVLQRGAEPLLEVYGGKKSRISFSSLRELRSGFSVALSAGQLQHHALIDFSIYSLPVADQNTFKLLLLIPLGAFVVVILRNLVGVHTSGTFMPILIALTFMQTTLAVGLLLFIAVVALGLLLRAYLSRLNLLLVPRISAVLVFVIVIYAAIGISTYKLGIDWGLKVTFFPMIILAWTIERMSILWEEEGGHEVLVQGSGSLLTAVLAYLLMSHPFVDSMIFMYPELLLVVLALIIWIGSYTGYRLSDLWRFEPMERL
jgi:hypothetical protein